MKYRFNAKYKMKNLSIDFKTLLFKYLYHIIKLQKLDENTVQRLHFINLRDKYWQNEHWHFTYSC